jgi:hypothetical protein
MRYLIQLGARFRATGLNPCCPVRCFCVHAIVAALVLAGIPLHAMTVREPTFAQLVGEAQQIVRVQVTDVSARNETAGGRRVVHTYVECRVLETLKGKPTAGVTLRFLGGRIGSVELRVADMPQFEKGGRYILFVRNNGASFCPLVGVMHGSYRVVIDPRTGVERVTRHDRSPLRRVADLGPGDRQSASLPATDVDSSLTRADFEAAIRTQLGRADEH